MATRWTGNTLLFEDGLRGIEGYNVGPNVDPG